MGAERRTLGPALLRIAGWPIETIEPLRSAALAARVDAWIVHEEAIRQESEVLARQLHDAIPKIDERPIRRAALELKRALHGTTQPLPETLVACLASHDGLCQILIAGLDAASRRRVDHAAERVGLTQAHAAELERASRELERLTSERPFLRALALASPSAFRQWQCGREGHTHERSRRRLHGTLYRYLIRAVGRATPNGLWAGVALEKMNPAATLPLGIAPAVPLTRMSPALDVFAYALEGLNLRRPWIDELRWRLNPTLRRVSPERWEHETFANGSWRVRHVVHHAALEVLMAQFAPSDRPLLREIESALIRHDVASTPMTARQMAEGWIELGVLWSTAALPPFWADPWQALDAIVETLPSGEKPIWQGCRETLARLATEVEARIEQIDPESLREHLDAARQAVNTVLARYGLAIPDTYNVLVLDRAAPFRFSLSTGFAKTIEAHLRAYWTFDRYGLGEIETQLAIRQFFGENPEVRPVPLDACLKRSGEAEAGRRTRPWEERVLSKAAGEQARKAREAFARWEREIGPCSERRTHDLDVADLLVREAPLPPGSALLLLGSSEQGPIVRVGGVTPEPCFFYSRFSHLFCSGDRDPDAFLTWQRRCIRAVESRWPQVRFLDLAIRNHRSPNVAARPAYAAQSIDTLDGTTDALRHAIISYNRDGRPLLSASGSTTLLIPSARSAADLGGLDRFASVLSSVSLFLGRPPLLTPTPRLSQEIETWRHLPRLRLREATISPERWTPHDHLGKALAHAEGAERFIRWRRYVGQAALPEFVYTFHGRHQSESLLATDSAIGIEFLAQELKAHGPSIRLQELFPAPGHFMVRDGDGQRFLAEMAVSWPGDPAFWDRYTEPGSLAEPEGAAVA